MIKKILGLSVILLTLCFGAYVLSVNASTVTGDLNTGLNTNVGSMDGIVIAAPSPSPAAGTYTAAQTVTLTAAGATKICYTTDDTTPSCATSITCTTGTALANGGTITISATDTIKSAACYNNNSTGPVATSVYTINIPSTGGGGGGGSSANPTVYCTSVTYSDWGSCVGGVQYRAAVSKSPANCSLTTAQQLAANQTCQVAEANEENNDDQSGDEGSANEGSSNTSSETPTASDLDISAIVNREKGMVKNISSSLTNRLLGRILLQVEEKGQAWYVEPISKEKHFMGRPVDAFSMMRRFGLGISETNFAKFQKSGVPKQFAGRIFLRVQTHGEAYYVNPVDMKMYYLGRPADAFRIMQELALGISNINLRQIEVGD